MKKALSICSLVLSVCFLQGCASITEGTSQSISLRNLPDGTCTYSRKENLQDVALNPDESTIIIKKSKDDITLNCNLKTGVTETKRITSSVSPAGITSVLFLDFGIVDTITGAMWKYPEEVDYNELKKIPKDYSSN